MAARAVQDGGAGSAAGRSAGARTPTPTRPLVGSHPTNHPPTQPRSNGHPLPHPTLTPTRCSAPAMSASWGASCCRAALVRRGWDSGSESRQRLLPCRAAACWLPFHSSLSGSLSPLSHAGAALLQPFLIHSVPRSPGAPAENHLPQPQDKDALTSQDALTLRPSPPCCTRVWQRTTCRSRRRRRGCGWT